MIAVGLLAGLGAAATAALAAGSTPPSGSLTARTIAGGPGGPARASTVDIGSPCGLTSSGQTLLVGTAAHGQVFDATVEDQSPGVVRAISATSGQLANLAGTTFAPIAGSPSPNGSPADAAKFVQSCDVAMDHHGNVVIADSAAIEQGFQHRIGNDLLRVVAGSTGTFYGQPMVKGDLYTIAGTGQFGSDGDGRPATQADIGLPAGVAVDAAGNVVLATFGRSGRIRVVTETDGTFYGQAMTAGDIYTIAGGGTTTACAAGAADGQLATSLNLGITTHNLRRNELTEPSGLRVDSAGNVVVAEATCGGRVQVIAAKSDTFYGRAMTQGHGYTVAGGGSASPASGGLAVKARLDSPSGIALDHAGNLIIADTSAHAVRVVAFSSRRFYGRLMVKGHLYTLAGGTGAGASGDGGPAGAARLFNPSAVAVDGQGNVAIADTGNFRVRLIAAKNGTFYGKAMHAGDIYTMAGPGQGTCSGNGGPATAATIGGELRLATDQAGDTLLLTPGKQCRLRLVAGQTCTVFGARRQAGHIYTVYNGTKGCPACAPAPLVPLWLAFDRAGNALFATSSKIAVVAARTGTFYGRHLTAGKTYVITGNHVIAEATGTLFGKHLTAGRVYSLAQDEFVQATDSHGNAIVIAPDSEVQVIAATAGTFYGEPMTAGNIYQVAGGGTSVANGAPALDTGFGNVIHVAVAPGGQLVVADNQSDTIRALS